MGASKRIHPLPPASSPPLCNEVAVRSMLFAIHACVNGPSSSLAVPSKKGAGSARAPMRQRCAARQLAVRRSAGALAATRQQSYGCAYSDVRWGKYQYYFQDYCYFYLFHQPRRVSKCLCVWGFVCLCGSLRSSSRRVESLENSRVRRKRFVERTSVGRSRQSTEVHSWQNGSDTPLEPVSSKVRRGFCQWAETSGVNVITTHPCSARHGGASSDALWRTHPFVDENSKTMQMAQREKCQEVREACSVTQRNVEAFDSHARVWTTGDEPHAAAAQWRTATSSTRVDQTGSHPHVISESRCRALLHGIFKL